MRCFLEPVTLYNPDADAIPRTHVHCVGTGPADIARRPVPSHQPDGQPARIRELTTGHDCMITEPARLTDLLLDIPTTEPTATGHGAA
ncbi:hypothetical protein GCM10009836_25470 [Pseudonocardia ailaonensis]|uniref:DUF4160 domain-containing protein n=1 Tax=Pseudonocardia ailaonensis TaxID=367279 RepID=A0ABN2MYW2_9PSEU